MTIDPVVRATTRIVTPDNQGSGFFVYPGLVATCLHVSGPTGSRVEVWCSGGAADAPFVVRPNCPVIEHDEASDVAIVAVTEHRDDWQPLIVAEPSDDIHRTLEWLAYGFPRVAKGQPVLIEGDVRLVAATDARGRPALQLYSDDAAAGKGAYLGGFSGSAVLCRGQVIAQLRSTPKDIEGNTQLGHVYATPSTAITTLVQRQVPDFGRRRREPHPPNAPYDPTWYVRRKREERDAADALKARKPVIISGPRYFGKSSLLTCVVDTATHAERQEGRDVRVVDIDLGGLALASTATLPEFFVVFLEDVLRSLRKSEPVRFLQQFVNHGGVMNGPSASAALQAILQESENPMYLVLRQPETLVAWEPLGLFLQVLRSWAMSQNQVFKRLRVLIELSTSLVSELMPNLNTAEHLVVREFDLPQAIELAALYELRWNHAEIEKLRDLVGGHPYLLQRAMYEASRDALGIRQIIEGAAEDGGVFRQFLEYNALVINSRVALRDCVCAIACGRPYSSAGVVERLQEAGIIRRRGVANVSIAYPLLKQYLEPMCRQ